MDACAKLICVQKPATGSQIQDGWKSGIQNTLEASVQVNLAALHELVSGAM